MSQRQRKIRVTAKRKTSPNTSRMARALLELAQAEAERAAEATYETKRRVGGQS